MFSIYYISKYQYIIYFTTISNIGLQAEWFKYTHSSQNFTIKICFCPLLLILSTIVYNDTMICLVDRREQCICWGFLLLWFTIEERPVLIDSLKFKVFISIQKFFLQNTNCHYKYTLWLFPCLPLMQLFCWWLYSL